MRSLVIAAALVAATGCSLNFGGGDDAVPGDDITSCEWNGQTYQPGDVFPYGDGCNSCSCDREGNVGCSLVACPACEADPGCPEGPACGGFCCGAGEHCEGDVCMCGDDYGCTGSTTCMLGPDDPVDSVPSGCGLHCCRPGGQCPPEPSSCLPEGGCAGPLCGGSCCGAGEHCDGDVCMCGSEPRCLPGDTCVSGGPVAPAGPTFCGGYCCGDLHGCPI